MPAPSPWEKEKVEEVKKGNPSYTDEQAYATVNKIWDDLSDSKKQEIRDRFKKKSSANVPTSSWLSAKIASLQETTPELTDSQAAAEASKMWFEQMTDAERAVEVYRSTASSRLDNDLQIVAAEFRNLFSTNYAKWIQMEVKLLAMNNFGKWESMADANEKINLASAEITKMLQKAVKSEVTRLIEEVRYDILDEMSATVKEEQVGLTPEGPAGQPMPTKGPAAAPAAPPVAGASKQFDIAFTAEDHKILDAMCEEDEVLKGLVAKTAAGEVVQASAEELKVAAEALDALLTEVKPGKLQERTAALREFIAAKIEAKSDADPLPEDLEKDTLKVLESLSFFIKNGDPSLKDEMQRSFDTAVKRLEELRKQKAEWLKTNEFKDKPEVSDGSN